MLVSGVDPNTIVFDQKYNPVKVFINFNDSKISDIRAIHLSSPIQTIVAELIQATLAVAY